jgi:purine-binding chemotaxis protein CheW
MKQTSVSSRAAIALTRASPADILKARARDLARPLNRPQNAGDILEVVEFRLAHECYAVEQLYVREVHPLRDLTPLPCTPAFVIGIINVRGRILPVIDIKKFFDLPDAGITDLHMVITVRVDEVEIGILADAVTGVTSIPFDTIQPTLPTLTGIRAEYLKGITNQHLVILDVLKILADPKIIVDEDIAAPARNPQQK